MSGLCDFCGKSTTHYNHDGCTPEGEAMSEMTEPTCTCHPTPEHMHTKTPYGTEPGSTLEPDYDCPVHFAPCPAEMTVSGVSLRCRLLDGHEDTGEQHGHGWVQVETSERGGA